MYLLLNRKILRALQIFSIKKSKNDNKVNALKNLKSIAQKYTDKEYVINKRGQKIKLIQT